MKTLTTFLVALFTTINSFSQTLIRWDLEDSLGNPTLSPTFIGDTSLSVNSINYSGIFPFGNGFTSGVSNLPLDFSLILRGWPSSFNWDYSDFCQFSFSWNTLSVVKIDSISLWWRKSSSGPKVIHVRSSLDSYSLVIDSVVSLNEIATVWEKWTIDFDSFESNDQQVTFRLYGNGANSSSLGTLALDSVAIFGQVSQLDSLSVKAVLSGPWNGTDMDDDLRVQGLVPLTDPYGFGKTTTADVLAVTGSNAIVDWVLISLRSPLDSTQVVYEAPFLLQRDGDVVALDGISSPLLPGGDYYISVSHRNHLGVMTATLVQDSVDFTNPATPVTGTESRVLVGDKALLWSGDASGNGVVKYTGSGNDRDPILVAIGGSVPTNTVSGYLNTDVNMDGVVKYTGSGNDRDYILLNVGGSVPTNTRISGIP